MLVVNYGPNCPNVLRRALGDVADPQPLAPRRYENVLVTVNKGNIRIANRQKTLIRFFDR